MARFLASSDNLSTLKLWNVQSGTLRRTSIICRCTAPPSGTEPAAAKDPPPSPAVSIPWRCDSSSVAWSPDGKTIAIGPAAKRTPKQDFPALCDGRPAIRSCPGHLARFDGPALLVARWNVAGRRQRAPPRARWCSTYGRAGRFGRRGSTPTVHGCRLPMHRRRRLWPSAPVPERSISSTRKPAPAGNCPGMAAAPRPPASRPPARRSRPPKAIKVRAANLATRHGPVAAGDPLGKLCGGATLVSGWRSLAVFQKNKDASIWDADSGKLLASSLFPDGATLSRQFPSPVIGAVGRFLCLLPGAAAIRVRRVADGQLLYTIVSLRDRQYAVINSDGRWRLAGRGKGAALRGADRRRAGDALAPGVCRQIPGKNRVGRVRATVFGPLLAPCRIPAPHCCSPASTIHSKGCFPVHNVNGSE